jgi:hypothetical protein
MSHEFIGFRLTGMKPADIRAGELATLLSSFEEMIASTVQRERPQITKDDLVIGLVKIEEGSIGLEFDTKLPELALPAYATITESVFKEQFHQLPSGTLKNLREIHSFVKAHDCEGEFFSRNGNVQVKAIITPKTVIPEHPKITAQITLYGRVMRVGGAEPRLMIEQPSGKSLFCEIHGEELARKIGERLYLWAGLEGTAVLDSDSLEILEFEVERLNEYQGTLSIKDSFAQLSKLAREHYADVTSVEEYISTLRS